MVTAGMVGTGPGKIGESGFACAEAYEMNAVCETCLHVIEIIAYVNNAVPGKMG